MDLIKSGAQQAAAGKELDSNTIGDLGGTQSSESTSGPDDDYRAENSTVDDLLPGSDDAPTASSGKEPASSKAPQKTSVNKEVITITDDKGRRKVEVDLENKEEVRKYVQMAYGARKWQAERDQALQSRKQIESKLAEREKDWNALEQAFQQGPEHLFDVLSGKRGAFQEHTQKQLQRAEFLKHASPEEVESLKAREMSERQSRELDEIRKENAKFKKEISQERETAEMRSLESRVNPVFDKYRFSERLGNADDEHMFDEMLWNSALKRLEPYEEQGLDLSPELIEKEFRTVAQAIRRRIGAQAEKKVGRVVEQKKQEATENVQSRVMSGYKTSGNAKEARDLIQSGNLTGLLKGWGKYGNLFNK